MGGRGRGALDGTRRSGTELLGYFQALAYPVIDRRASGVDRYLVGRKVDGVPGGIHDTWPSAGGANTLDNGAVQLESPHRSPVGPTSKQVSR